MAGVLQAGLIFLGFGFLMIANFISIGLKKIEDNWHLYRCNPLVMPLAGLLGKNPTANMAECIKQMQGEYMSVLMQPIDFNFGMLTQIASTLSSSISESMTFVDGFRDMIGSLTIGIFGAFSSIISGFTLTIMAIRDIVARLTAVVFLINHAIQSLLWGGESLWKGPPGQITRALCFSPETLIDLPNGGTSRIDRCCPGTVLKGNIIVNGLMEINNRSRDGAVLERMCKFSAGAVSGSHLVWCSGSQEFVKAREHESIGSTTAPDSPVLYCLITSNHTIPSGGFVFHDWEDNNGSPSKSV
tara:strand:+ start:61 stop:960 length:900 start_codon:yes stop_codon:yes gene_type:complete